MCLCTLQWWAFGKWVFFCSELKRGQSSLTVQGGDMPTDSALALSRALLWGWEHSSTDAERLASILNSLQKKRGSTFKASMNTATSTSITSKALQYPQTNTSAIPTGKGNSPKETALQKSQLWCSQDWAAVGREAMTPCSPVLLKLSYIQFGCTSRNRTS